MTPTVALVFHGDRDTRDTVNLDEHRLGPTAAAMRAVGLEPVAAVYNDDFADEVREQLLQVNGVQAWVNPIEQGRGREKLDAILKEVADAGVLVSAHPDTIQKMGTKQVLYDTRHMGWGSDVHVYRTLGELEEGLPARLREGKPRVLKQFRGHSGQGIWKVSPHPSDSGLVLARHAARGSTEQAMPFSELLDLFAPYFAGDGRMVDQAYQDRIKDGMVRCYLVQGRVEGFGHQAINALYPAAEGAEESQPGPRLYHPPTAPEFQRIKQKMESEWLPELLSTLGMSLDELPMLWDADIMFGPRTASGEDTYVLCEINVSSVFPYPESAMRPLALAFKERLTRVR
jgi:hypothetical protein